MSTGPLTVTELPVIDIFTAREQVGDGKVDGALVGMRGAMDHFFQAGVRGGLHLLPNLRGPLSEGK